MSDVKIHSFDNKEFSAYCATAKGGRGPGLIVIQEIFGVNAGMRKICDDFAAKGYTAICPDLFWRQQPGIQLTDKTPAEWDTAMDLMKGFDVETGIRDLLATLAHLRKMQQCNGKVGAVGYCLGGLLAFLMGTRSDVDACASYYGVNLDKYTDEIHDIRMPMLVHIAGKDEHVPPPVREKILKAIKLNPAITPYVYDSADHAFARPGGKNFDAEAARLANERTDALFAKYLQS